VAQGATRHVQVDACLEARYDFSINLVSIANLLEEPLNHRALNFLGQFRPSAKTFPNKFGIPAVRSV